MSSQRFCVYLRRVSATQVIEEIQQLTPTEQAEVIQFAYRVDEREISIAQLQMFATWLEAGPEVPEGRWRGRVG